MLEKIFKLKANATNVRTEVRAGVVTFMTMAYIIFVQPAVMKEAGMDFGAVMAATCIAAAVATTVMAFAANYPIALAPCMGENFFFVSVATGAVTGVAVGWQAALAAVFIAGALFLLLSAFRFREKVFESIPLSLKASIAVGIGLLIAFVGLKNAGIIVDSEASLVTLGDLTAKPTLLALGGLILVSVLLSLKVRGALLISLLATAVTGVPAGIVKFEGFVEAPPSLAPVFLKLDFSNILDVSMITVVAIFLFMVLFDTIGTLIGVGQQAGLLDEEGKLERAGPALLADAVGTTCGSLIGSSTVSSYIESAAGVNEGGRTGLCGLTTAVLFILALFFAPVVRMVGGGCVTPDGVVLNPVTAPVLIIVGYLMAKGVRAIPWDEPSDAIPAFITMIGIPLTNIGDGIALGFVSFALIKVLSGKGRDVSLLAYIMAALLMVLFAVRMG